MLINPANYHKLIAEAQAAHFQGWDFRWLKDRMIQEDPPWDYADLVKGQFQGIKRLLDMGTGGGELLSSMTPLPQETHATETYPPNQPIARARLAPLGVRVHLLQDNTHLPFYDHYFDLVINRHEDFNPWEVSRVLKPGGMFITQQVGGLDNLELNQVLEPELSFPFRRWGLATALTRLYEVDMAVDRAESAALQTSFKDIGAVVYYLKAIPWQIEGFHPHTHAEGLTRIHAIIQRQGHFTTTAHRFLIIARKKERQW